jgi:hypothetical protein
MCEPASFRNDGGHAVMPVTFEEQLPLARVMLGAADGGSAEATVEVDTGVTGSLTLTRASLSRGAPPPFPQISV